MAARLLSALVALLLQSLIVMAAAGSAALPLAHALRWLERHAHAAPLRHLLSAGLAKPLWFASGVWLLAQLCLLVHSWRGLRHGHPALSWATLFTPLLMVVYVGAGLLVLAAMAVFVSNTARVFLTEPASVWAGVAAAALLGIWLLQIGWSALARRPTLGRR